MEYKIVVGDGKKVEGNWDGLEEVESWNSNIVRFENKINDMIKEGWKPLGGCQSNMANYVDFAVIQTMIKE